MGERFTVKLESLKLVQVDLWFICSAGANNDRLLILNHNLTTLSL